MANETKSELAMYINRQQADTALLTSFLANTSIAYKESYEAACSMAGHNIESSLLLMIKTVLSKDMFIDESIRDSALLWVQYEGNRNTTTYLVNLLNSVVEEDNIQYINDMIDSIKWKYKILGLKSSDMI